MNNTGSDPYERGTGPVRTTLHRVADVARIVGAVFQAIYYGLKIW